MKVLVGVYDTHDEADAAAVKLKEIGYPEGQVSLIAKADMVNNHIHINAGKTIEKNELGTGIATGAVIGALTGVGIFMIPGVGLLYAAGALLVGILGGIDFGLIGGGVHGVFASIGIDEMNSAKYINELNEGKHLVFVQGSEMELKRAEQTLATSEGKLELSSY